MRIALAIVFVMFFVGALSCGIILGGTPTTIYEFSDVIIGIAVGLLFLASIILIALVFGIGSAGKKRSVWRLPILCLVTAFLGFVFGLAIIGSEMEDLTPEVAAVNLRLKIYAVMVILFALFSGLCLIVSFFLAKRHNGKLPPTA